MAMTLRDIGGWFSDLKDDLMHDVQIVFAENIIDWPLWIFIVIGGVLLLLVIPMFLELVSKLVGKDDDPYADFWDSVWAILALFCVTSGLIISAFTGIGGIPLWAGVIGLICWPIFGYAFFVKLRRRFKK